MNGRIAFSVLLAVLLVSVMVPTVSAGGYLGSDSALSEDPGATAFDATSVTLPVLQFDEAQEKMTVNAELSPTEFKGVHSIPRGSIIYHSKDGITTVFNASGNQIFAAIDERSQILHTPSGVDKPATYIHRVPGDSHVYSHGNDIYITDQSGELILTIINGKADISKGAAAPDQIKSLYLGWLEYADDVVPGGLTQFDAYWHVPSAPPAMDYGKAVFIFNGVEPPELRYGLLQPVLAFYPYENGWNWYGEAWCYAMDPYDPDTDSIVGPRISVSTGDRIKGRILWSSTYNQWYVQLSDLTTGEYSTIWSSLVPRHDNLEVSVVLEAKVVDDNNDMPGDIEFYDMVFKNNGVPVGGVNFEGHIDPNKPPGVTGLQVQIISNPSNIKLHTYN